MTPLYNPALDKHYVIVGKLKARVEELEEENERLAKEYKDIITRLNQEEADINISPQEDKNDKTDELSRKKATTATQRIGQAQNIAPKHKKVSRNQDP